MQETSHDSEPSFDEDKGIRKGKMTKLTRFLIIAAMLVFTTILNIFLEKLIQPSSLIFVYLVPAIAGAIYFGTWAAVISFTAGFLIFDFTFVEPYYSLHISNPQDVYNVIVYFAVAGLITYLINTVYNQNIFLKGRLKRVSLIEDMSKDLLFLSPVEQNYIFQNITPSMRTSVLIQLGQIALRYTKVVVDAPALVFFRDDAGALKLWVKSSIDLEITEQENDAAVWTFDNGDVSGSGTNSFSDNRFYFFPMKSLEGTIGVIGILYNSRNLFTEQRYLLGTISNLITIVATMWMNLNMKETLT